MNFWTALYCLVVLDYKKVKAIEYSEDDKFMERVEKMKS